MPKLKLGPIADDKPVKITLELPANLHRDLTTYAEILGREAGQPATDPMRLIVPMLERRKQTLISAPLRLCASAPLRENENDHHKEFNSVVLQP